MTDTTLKYSSSNVWNHSRIARHDRQASVTRVTGGMIEEFSLTIHSKLKGCLRRNGKGMLLRTSGNVTKWP